eukprot:TRINITY_DN10575_c0_g1_i1.p1 TRINITY_DN10575_c0_g1~~TRINITY_DN10575_c0_g1_i1.p1  ORF type:complete len:326 (-),score=15.09 TRINITY_DN10575_c0_g1_i1:98-1075(-)
MPGLIPVARTKIHSEVISQIIELEDGTIVSCSWDQTIHRWNQNGRLINSFNGHSNNVSCVVQINEDAIASSSWDNTIKIWNIQTSECIKTITNASQAWCLVRRRDKSTWLSGLSSSEVIQFWTSDDYSLIRSFGTNACVKSLCELTNGNLVVGSLSRIDVWEDQGELKCTLTGHSSWVNCLRELRDSVLVSASQDETVKLWDVTAGACLHTFRGHNDNVVGVVELLDDIHLVSASVRMLNVWNRISGSCMVRQTTVNVWAIERLRNGSIVIGGNAGVIEIWKMPNSLMDLCCEVVVKQYERDQLRHMLPTELYHQCLPYYHYVGT